MSLARAGRLAVAWSCLLLIACVLGRTAADVATGADRSIVDAVRVPRTGAVTDLTRAVTWLGSPLWLEIVFGIAVIGLGSGRRWRDLMFLGLASPGTVLLVQLTKAIVARPRPPGPHLTPVTGYSWPSGHASSSAALYGALLLILVHDSRLSKSQVRVIGAVVAVTLVAIGVSRVALGVHYPSDVLGAWLIVAIWLTVLGVAPTRPGLSKPAVWA